MQENIFIWLADYRVPAFAYPKKHLSELYRNNSGASMSRKQQLNLIKTVRKGKEGKSLWTELDEIGYTPKRQFYTIKEVQLIFEYIGEPYLTGTNKEFLLEKGYITEEDLDYADMLKDQQIK